MDSKGMIGVIIPQVSSNIDTQFIDAVHTTASGYGYDTIVITCGINYVDEHLGSAYSRGQTNIFDVMLHGGFDGFIFEADTFCSEKLRRELLELLKKQGSPCVAVNYEQPFFPVVSADEKVLMYLSAMHLIKEHGCKKLYCIGGSSGHAPSEARISGFRRAMDEAGLGYSEDDIFYGNYWRDVPHKIAVDIAEGRLAKPDGIVCGSDIMAVELISTLTGHGIRVPEDIAVMGCDGSILSQSGRISVSTVAGQERINGILAATELLGIMGESVPDCEAEPELVIGESCGCGDNGRIVRSRSLSDIREYAGAVFRLLEQRKTNSHGEMIRRMSECRELSDVTAAFRSCCYMIPTGIRAELCLCSDWCRSLDDPSVYRRGGLPGEMLLGTDTCCADGEKSKSFSTSELFPSLKVPHPPRLTVMTSLHYKGQIFGYVGFTYEKAVHIVLDDFYMSWCDAVSSGLNNVQNRMYKDYVNKRIELLSEFAPVLGIYNKRGLINKMMNLMAENSSSDVELTLLSYIREERVHYSVPPVNSIVNAIRLSGDNAVLASLGDDVIAVVHTERRGNARELAAEVADIVRSSYMGTVEIKQDRIEVVSCTVSQSEILGIDRLISDMEDKLRGRMISRNAGAFSYRESFDALRNDIMKHPEKDWNIDSITRRMGLSKTHFHRIYKEFYGSSCKDDIICSRLEKVRWMLDNTTLTIVQIAEECGYSNNSHLIRQFTGRTGMTPSAYRKRNNKRQDH